MRDLHRTNGITVLHQSKYGATVSVTDLSKIQILNKRGYMFRKEELNVFLVTKQ